MFGSNVHQITHQINGLINQLLLIILRINPIPSSIFQQALETYVLQL